MEVRHLRYFVAVAEERHFTRAAERLGIKQPPSSLQIRQLEQELGTSLFRRPTRGAELTEAGTLLLEEARRILEQVERAKANVQSRARGETGHIRVGFAGATYFQPRVPGLVQAYRRLYPSVVISPEQSNTPNSSQHCVKVPLTWRLSGRRSATATGSPFNRSSKSPCGSCFHRSIRKPAAAPCRSLPRHRTR